MLARRCAPMQNRKRVLGHRGASMIVSYRHNYIFIKTKKTAGTTIEWVLAQSCGPEDITTTARPDEREGRRARRRQSTFSAEDLEDLSPAERFRRLRDLRDKAAKRKLKEQLRSEGDFHNHISAEQLRPLLDETFWNSALKFTAERHPYEKAVSFAYFQYNQSDRHIASFERLLDQVVRQGGYEGFRRWSIGGIPAVDDFIRQESLLQDLRRIGERLGIPIPDDLPQLKGNARKDRRPAREILTDEQKRIVFETCRAEFNLLGYEP